MVFFVVKTIFIFGFFVLYLRMLVLFEVVNIFNEEGLSLCVFVLFCIVCSIVLSIDGYFINIIEG